MTEALWPEGLDDPRKHRRVRRLLAVGLRNVYRAIAETFGTTGARARMLAGIFDVPLLWFAAWEAHTIKEVLHPETAAVTVGYGPTRADVRDDLALVQAPTLRERSAWLDVEVIPDSHPRYVLVQRPEACAAAATAFFARHPL